MVGDPKSPTAVPAERPVQLLPCAVLAQLQRAAFGSPAFSLSPVLGDSSLDGPGSENK
jgi:hypothetical protein